MAGASGIKDWKGDEVSLHVYRVPGNYDFSPRGTKYLVLISIICTDLDPGTPELYKLKHR